MARLMCPVSAAKQLKLEGQCWGLCLRKRPQGSSQGDGQKFNPRLPHMRKKLEPLGLRRESEGLRESESD